MNSAAGAVIASSIMLSSTILVLAGLFWFTTERARDRGAAARSAAAERDGLRAELAEVRERVAAIQRLLEDAVDERP
ncbi:hypothetical protein OG521_18120 [Streptomyces sp. NBC_01463]|uniref:hypothetical protein n=1 Tax=Streptomyces sp. RTGN2 TaxID=3016525 RepID=UPI0025538E7F|nr:hypothetical protein [Streptomyces sp. RTGN2]